MGNRESEVIKKPAGTAVLSSPLERAGRGQILG